MLFVKYEDLCSSPETQLKQIYNYFELPYYAHHNFNYIEQLTHEDDSVYGVFGDHKVKPKLAKTDNDPIKLLGRDICSWIDNNFKWYNDIFKY
jgi:sulfotransferase